MGLKIYDESGQLQFDSDRHSVMTIAYRFSMTAQEFLSQLRPRTVEGASFFVQPPISLPNNANYLIRAWAENPSDKEVDLYFITIYRFNLQGKMIAGYLPAYGNWEYHPIFNQANTMVHFIIFRY